MLRSMTAFGRATADQSLGRFIVEIQSVNKKYLEVSCFCPKELARFEVDIKKQITAAVARGQVLVRLFVEFKEGAPISATANVPFAAKIKEAYEVIAIELKLDSHVDLRLLARHEGVISYVEQLENEEVWGKALQKVVQAAIEKLIEMKEREGACLLADIEKRMGKLNERIEKIGMLTAKASDKCRVRLEKVLKEVVPNIVDNEERILREVCIFADRVDIAEEITRLKAHMGHIEQVLKGDSHRVGKKLEFILQELFREINTVGSKAGDVEVSRLVVDVKSELERIREQIQNVE